MVAYVSLEGEETALTYAQLYERTAGLASQLEREGHSDAPVLLLFHHSIEFLINFLACQWVGRIAVPMFYPKNNRHFARLQTIMEDAQSDLILCPQRDAQRFEQGLLSMGVTARLLPVDFEQLSDTSIPPQRQSDCAFLQYTSGSTGQPKGVMVSQENLQHNLMLLADTFDCRSDAVILSWLPFYHDMGLIGNLLLTLHVGCRCILLPPVSVVQHPVRWLRAIQRFGATHSGGPNFIYDACVQRIPAEEMASLDLSCWQIAYNGSEPIRADSLQQFQHKFASVGFRPEALRSCYGLAEATLLVSAGSPTITDSKISSGRLCPELSMIFYDAADDSVHPSAGEICLAGQSITHGYWNKANAPFFIEWEGRSYFRTGDIGECMDGELFILGRTKEMIILKGKNIFPYDLERLMDRQIEAVADNGVVVSCLDEQAGQLLVFAELKRSFLQQLTADVLRRIDQLLLQQTGLPAHDILLLSPRRLPRTSSGKLQRTKARDWYRSGDWECIASKKARQGSDHSQRQRLAGQLLKAPDRVDVLQQYLRLLLEEQLLIDLTAVEDFDQLTLMDQNVTSLLGVQIVNQVNSDLQLQMEASRLLQLNRIKEIKDYIINLLWLKSNSTQGEEITI